MKASEFYGRTPIKLDAFTDVITSITGPIVAVASKDFDTGRKLVIDIGDEWSMVLNATNYRVLAKAFGDETDDWIDKPVTAFKGTLHYRNEEKDGVCLRIPPQAEEKTVTAADLVGQASGGDAITDDIPF